MSYSFKPIRKAPLPMLDVNVSIFSVQLDPNTGMVFIAIPEWERLKLRTSHIDGLIQNILNTTKQDLIGCPINKSTLAEITQKIDRLIKYNRGVPDFDAFLTVNGY